MRATAAETAATRRATDLVRAAGVRVGARPPSAVAGTLGLQAANCPRIVAAAQRAAAAVTLVGLGCRAGRLGHALLRIADPRSTAAVTLSAAESPRDADLRRGCAWSPRDNARWAGRAIPGGRRTPPRPVGLADARGATVVNARLARRDARIAVERCCDRTLQRGRDVGRARVRRLRRARRRAAARCDGQDGQTCSTRPSSEPRLSSHPWSIPCSIARAALTLGARSRPVLRDPRREA